MRFRPVKGMAGTRLKDGQKAGTFGQRKKSSEPRYPYPGVNANAGLMVGGYAAGMGGGLAATALPGSRKRQKQISANRKTLSAERKEYRELKSQVEKKFGPLGRAGKLPVKRTGNFKADKDTHLITDMGSPGAKRTKRPFYSKEDRRGLRNDTLMAAGIGAGGGAFSGGMVNVGQRNELKQTKIDVASQRRRNTNLKSKIGKSGDMSGHDAFGIYDPISKAAKKKRKDPTTGRMVAGTLFGPYHGAFAGKGAKGKVKSAGTQLGGTIGGTALGTAIGGRAGGAIGSMAGAAGATGIAHNKGWLKDQK